MPRGVHGEVEQLPFRAERVGRGAPEGPRARVRPEVGNGGALCGHRQAMPQCSSTGHPAASGEAKAYSMLLSRSRPISLASTRSSWSAIT